MEIVFLNAALAVGHRISMVFLVFFFFNLHAFISFFKA